MAMEHEQDSAYVSARERFTSVEVSGTSEEPAPSTARAFSKTFFEYRSEDIEVRHQIGEEGQARVFEVLVNTGARFGGGNPKYETWAAKVFYEGHYGQWQELANGLGEYYGGFLCHFHGYCQKFNSPKIKEKDSFCLLMKKYDCSLYNVIEEEKKKDNYTGRPFKTGVALSIIFQIALGMEIVHKVNLVHRDLKSENIFVHKNAGDNMPWGVFIGDFDIGVKVSGTLFWRAPEVLESHDKGLSPTSTTMADVYSFGMVCYEILTGDAPLLDLATEMGHKYVREAVYRKGLRPELPADLHPKIKDLIVRCWNRDPLQRPSFTAIVTELRTIFKAFPELRFLVEGFEKVRNVLPLAERPTPEECLSRLERRLDELRLKYPVEIFGYQPGDIDFVMAGYELLKSVKKFVLQFGYTPFIDHPSLPWSMWSEREKLLSMCLRLFTEFNMALPCIEEMFQIVPLARCVFETILKDREVSNSCIQEEGTSPIQMLDEMKSWWEEMGKLPPLLDRHVGCVQKNNYGEYEGDKDFPICNFCKDENPSMLKVENAQIQTFYLFHPDHARSTSWFSNLFREIVSAKTVSNLRHKTCSCCGLCFGRR